MAGIGSSGEKSSNKIPAHSRSNSKPLIERPIKDVSAQKAAQDVEGLKGYQLGACLGKGAFASVYKALNWGTGSTVAIKQVKLENLPKTELKVIMLEIDLLKKLNHSHIVKYHGFVKSIDSLYIILEYCEGGSLHSICRNFGKFPETLVALYMSQVLQGLVYLHEQGVIHRDIKGANILTTKDGLVKLADFGVATKSNVSEYSVVGTPYWMAPEVIELSGATTASDIWSLGCTVIELLDGQPPYHKLQPMPALFRIVNDDHPPLPEGASPAVRDFLMQCFQKDPNLRVTAKKLLKHPWLVNARKTDSVVAAPTKYDEAVKSVQQWNEALKSPEPENSLRSRPNSLSPLVPGKKEFTQNRWNPPIQSKPLTKLTPRTNTEPFRSPDLDGNTIWDDDFPAPISASALKLPHLRPHDNFSGLLSMDNLKNMAITNNDNNSYFQFNDSMDQRIHQQSPAKIDDFDPHQTVRALSPRKQKLEFKSSTPNSSISMLSNRNKTQIQKESLSPTKYQQLSPTPHSKPKLQIRARNSSIFKEDTVEDYSDLLLDSTDDDAFLRKIEALKIHEPQQQHHSQHQQQKQQQQQQQQQLQSTSLFAPQLFHHSDLKNVPRPSYTTRTSMSLRRYPSADLPKIRQGELQRTRSSLEIQKYAEDENEDPEAFLERDLDLSIHGDDMGSEQGTLLMSASKISTHSIEDDEEYDDPFAQLEEDFDQMDLEANVARDRYARLCTFVEGLVGSLQMPENEEILDEISEQLIQVLSESPELKNVIISSHGILPILEILEGCTDKHIILRLLKIINLVVFENVEMLENLCFIGVIPIVSEYALKQFSSQIRHEAAAFVRQICQFSTLALQMFVSCGGLNVLVGFIEEDMESERDLVLIGVNGICSVFELQGPTPKNDFCRILSRSSILYPLSLVLDKLMWEKGDLAQEIIGRIINIFLPFSQAENYVKETVADRMVLKRILGNLKRMTPTHQVSMLKFIKNLSMLPTTHEALQNSNAIEVLTALLNQSMELPHSREVPNNVLHILFNLCRLNKTRQEDAALSGLIPLLQKVVKTNKPFKELALPILCDMAHCGYVGQRELWQYQGLQFYISLLSDKYWQVTALDAIFVWLQEETAKVEQVLVRGPFAKAIVDCYNLESSNDAFENFLDPLQKLLVLSPPAASTLAHPDIFIRTAQKLVSKKALVRGNLLRIIRSICDASDHVGGASLIREFGLFYPIENLSEKDPAVMVRELASELIKMCIEREAESDTFDNATPPSSSASSSQQSVVSRQIRPTTRRSSSSTIGTPNSHMLVSSPITTSTPPLVRSSTGKLLVDNTNTSSSLSSVSSSIDRKKEAVPIPVSSGTRHTRLVSAALTPLRPTSRDGSSITGGTSKNRINNSGGGPTSAATRSSAGGARLSRLSIANRRDKDKEDSGTPTHSPIHTASGRGQSSQAVVPGAQRKRRVTASSSRVGVEGVGR